jgi:nucleotide-binding universal stress UspA family protein
MRTVLLPTDFSKNSVNAISYALELYREQPCTFKFLYCYKVDDYQEESLLTPIPSQEKLEQAHSTAQKRLHELINKLEKNKDPGHSFESIAENRPLITAIRQQISLIHPEVIIIGTQGDTGAVEAVYGSNTLNIMEEIMRCPVLAVPSNATFRGLREIVLANSFKVELMSSDLDFLLDLSRRYEAPVRVLHVLEEGGLSEHQRENKQALRKHLSHMEHSFHSLEFLSIPLAIYSFTQSRGSEMIAFINKKHSFLENLLFSPLYRNLAHYSRIPVLVLHQP